VVLVVAHGQGSADPRDRRSPLHSGPTGRLRRADVLATIAPVNSPKLLALALALTAGCSNSGSDTAGSAADTSADAGTTPSAADTHAPTEATHDPSATVTDGQDTSASTPSGTAGTDGADTTATGVDTSLTEGPDTQSSTSSDGTTASSGADDSTTGLFPGVCGDGVHNLGEACDDGDFDNTDECTEYCLAAACGDGYVQQGETCDDGNQIDGDGCNVDCFNSGDTVWELTFDGEDHLGDDGHAVAVDGAGAVVVVGSTGVTGENTNIYLLKVASDGAVVWQRDVSGVGPDVGYDVATSAADEIFVTGTYHVSAMPDPGGKIYTAGFAPNGNEKWSAKTATHGNGRAIVVADDGSVYTTGDIKGTMGPDLWLERRDAAGALAWTTTNVYGDDSSCDLDYHENPEGIAVDPPHVYVAWRSTCPGGQFPAGPRTKVSRFIDDGTVTKNPDPCCSHWRIDVFSPGVFTGVPTRGMDMARGPEDELVIAGEANGGGYLWGYGPDLYTTQTYNSALWEGTPGGARFVDLAIDGAGNLVLAGDGGRVVKTDPDAQLLWDKSFPGLTARGVAVDAGGYVYVVGSVDGQGADVALRKLAP
jgi:cysteine-rich repeat protein